MMKFPRPAPQVIVYTLTMPTTDGDFSTPRPLPEFATAGYIMDVQVRGASGTITEFDLYIYDESVAQLGDAAPSGPPVLESRVAAWTAETISTSTTEGVSLTIGDVMGAPYKVPPLQTMEETATSNLRLVAKRVASGGAGAASFKIRIAGDIGAFNVQPGTRPA